MLAALLHFALPGPAHAEDESENLAGAPAPMVFPEIDAVSQTQLDANISQIKSEVRAQSDLTELRLNVLENEVQQSADYVERLLLAFMIAGGVVVFVVLATLNKQSGINNEKMRNLIREAEHTLGDLHRMLDRPEAEHFHVSRKLTRIMNKIRSTEHPSLAQKEIGDIYAASEDPTLPVTLHLQANALRREQSGDYEQAIILWERLLGIEDNNPEILLQLAKNYKKLSEASSGARVGGLRNTSLEYFQQYALRTNQHTSTVHDLQRHMGASATQLPTPLEQTWGVTEQQPSPMGSQPPGQQGAIRPGPTFHPAPAPSQPPAQEPQQPKITRAGPAFESQPREGYAGGQVSGVAKLKSLRREPTPPPARAAVKPTISPAEDAAGKAEPPSPQVSEKEAMEKDIAAPEQPAAAPAPAAAADANAEAVAGADGTGEGLAFDSSANGEESKVKRKAGKKLKVERRKKQSLGTQLRSANGDAGEGSAEAVPIDKMTDADKERAYSSRMDKAKEYFRRFGDAKKKGDKMRWLMMASDELKSAKKYRETEMLFRLGGNTWLEISNLGKGDQDEHLKTALAEFTQGEEKYEGAFCCEIALCHARLNDEEECRSAIEKARSLGTLNISMLVDEPGFESFKDRSWYQQLVSVN